jgi:hypothetical protein
MKTARIKRRGVVGVLPDGKHVVMVTKLGRDAFIAECAACETYFDNYDPAITLAQGVAMHRGGAGHQEFIYYSIETLFTGETYAGSGQ